MTVTWGRRLVSSLITALAVAIVTHIAVIIAYYFTQLQQLQAAYIPLLSDFFFLASLFLFVFVFAFAAIDGLRFWFTALAAGLFSGIVASLLSALIAAATAEEPVADLWGSLWASLLSINGLFVIVATIVTATAGRAIWHAVVGYRLASGATDRRIAIVRMPAGNLAEGLVTHIERSEIDAELADKQWDGYVQALEANGWSTVEASFADTHADSVFVEDTVVLLGETAVITRPGAESRRGETEGVESTVSDLGLSVERIMAPGTLEGGDVLKVGDTIYVGRSDRTNADGVRQLRAIAAPLGYDVVAVPVTKVLHLKTGVTALPDGTVIGHPDLVDDPSLFDRFVAVPEHEGVAVVVLSDDTVLMSSSAPKTAKLIEDFGYTVVSVDLSEFEKLEGCVTCLSVRVR